MKIKRDDIELCLRAAWTMSEQYRQYALAPDRSDRSVDTLLWICRMYLAKKIEVLQAPIPATADKTIRAAYVATGDRHDIILLANMERVWRRFALCKEIFHILIAHEESLSANIFGHLEEVTLTFPVMDSEPNCAAAWEKLAEAAAMEFLFPAVERKPMNMAEVSGGQIDALAARYDIPRVFIETYCSEPACEFFDVFEKIRVEEAERSRRIADISKPQPA